MFDRMMKQFDSNNEEEESDASISDHGKDLLQQDETQELGEQ
jgi:hypothetical protein